MARIPLYNDPQLLKSGDQTLRPAQFRIAESTGARALGQIADAAIRMSVGLAEKNQQLDNARIDIDLERDIAETDLQRTKWQEMNKNDDQIEKSGVNQWESNARTLSDGLMSRWTQRPMTPEMRTRIMDRINNYANKTITTSYGQALSQKGNNFTSTLDAMRTEAIRTGDFGVYDVALEAAKTNGIYSQENWNALKADRDDAFAKNQIASANMRAATKIDRRDYDGAKAEYDTLVQSGILKKEQADSYKTTIEYKFQYNEKLDAAELDAQDDPLRVLQGLDAAEAAVSPRIITNENAAAIRKKFEPEIMSAAVADKFITLMAAEVGGQGEQAQLAFAETVFNRAAATGRSIDSIISDTRYYEPYQTGAIDRARQSLDSNARVNLNNIIMQAFGGSNITNGATDNASADVAASVKQGGYNAVADSVVDIGGETFYTKTYYNNANETASPDDMQGTDLRFASPNDRRKLANKARASLQSLMAAQVNKITEDIDLGRYDASVATNEQLFNEALDNNRYLTENLRTSLRMYRDSKINKALVNHPSTVGSLKTAIADYATRIRDAEAAGQKYDEDQLEFLMLGNRINLETDDFIKTELNQELRNVAENTQARTEYAKLNAARKLIAETVLNFKQPAVAVDKKTGRSLVDKTGNPIVLYSEREAVDASGKKFVTRTPLVEEIPQDERDRRIQDAQTLEFLLKQELKNNKDMTPQQLTDKLRTSDLYLEYKLKSAQMQQKTPAGVTKFTPAIIDLTADAAGIKSQFTALSQRKAAAQSDEERAHLESLMTQLANQLKSTKTAR